MNSHDFVFLLAVVATASLIVSVQGFASMKSAPGTAPKSRMALDAAKFKVAVVGGGPSGACAAEILAQNPDIECTLFERKMDNCKPCGGAIPVCMIEEFNLPMSIVDRKVRKMKLISPTNREVDIGQTLEPNEFIGMLRREVMDSYLRDRAIEFGAVACNALVTDITLAKGDTDKHVIKYTNFDGNTNEEAEFDYIIGGDGANSRVAKAMDAGEYNYAIAFQERIKISEEKMNFYEELAEMYVGDDVSPDFYAWVFPKYDHVGVGTGTVVNRPAIKQYQNAISVSCCLFLKRKEHDVLPETHPGLNKHKQKQDEKPDVDGMLMLEVAEGPHEFIAAFTRLQAECRGVYPRIWDEQTFIRVGSEKKQACDGKGWNKEVETAFMGTLKTVSDMTSQAKLDAG